MKILFNPTIQNKNLKQKNLRNNSNINFMASRLSLKTPEIKDSATKQFFEKLVYYWQKFPENCKIKKPVLFSHPEGVAAFFIDKTTKDTTKFLIKDQVPSDIDWNDKNLNRFDMEMTINKDGQMEQGNILTDRNVYKSRAFFDRNQQKYRAIQYDSIEYFPSKHENKIWRAKGSAGHLLTLPKNKGLQLSDLFMELSGATTSFVAKTISVHKNKSKI